MEITQQGMDFIESFEGCVLHLYNDPTGNCSVGIGYEVHPGVCNGATSEAPYKNGITQAQAYDLFKNTLVSYVAAVNNQVKVKINQNQFNALVSLCYNVGPAGFSGLLALLNAGNIQGAADAFLWYCHDSNGNVIEGLYTRRVAERILFLTAVTPPAPAIPQAPKGPVVGSTIHFTDKELGNMQKITVSIPSGPNGGGWAHLNGAGGYPKIPFASVISIDAWGVNPSVDKYEVATTVRYQDTNGDVTITFSGAPANNHAQFFVVTAN